MVEECSVLGCTNPGSNMVAGGGNHEVYVCTEHKALMDAGAPWDLQGRSVVMDQDLAPLVEGWQARPSAGAGGLTLSLELAGQAEPIHVFLPPAEARALAAFIRAANGEG